MVLRDATWPRWVPGVVVTTVYALLTLFILQRGFLEYNADGYTRIVRGHEWLNAPRWEVGIWLPLQTWLFGGGLFLHDALAVTPRVIDVALTVWTLINLYLIGRTLAGRWAGFIAALLGAIFPWVVWLGVSGMSEPLFHATLSLGVLGFVRWVFERRLRWLVIAAVGLLLSTMVRYEGWFYAATFAALVILLAWRWRALSARIVALAALPLAFPLVWIEQYWQLYGDPLGFAHETADMKAALDSGNTTAGLIRKLTAYPEATARLAPWLALLCVAAACYALYRRVRWWPVIALVGGQAALLTGVSAAFSNLGPGAERYLLSNFILLFPVLGAALVLLPRGALRLVGVALLTFAAIGVIRTAVRPPTWYPDQDTRDVASVVKKQEMPPPQQNTAAVPVLLPPAPAEGFNASYALRILSDHPDGWVFTSDPQLFTALLATTNPPMWIVDTDAAFDPPSAQTTQQVGRFVIGWPVAPVSP
jgi:hypothetical protein